MPLFFGGGVGIFLLYYRIVLCFGVVNCDLVLNLVSTDRGIFFWVWSRVWSQGCAIMWSRATEVAVHPKPWSTEVIFKIGARLYIGSVA